MSTTKLKVTKTQLKALRWAKNKFSDGRVPPFVFRDYRSPRRLIEAGLIEFWADYGATMYRFTQDGLDFLEQT